MKHRRTSLPLALEHRLNTHALAASAAGVGLLALAQPAEAKIVFTPVHQKLPINQDFYIDLNHDGTNDFSFRAGHGGQGHDTFVVSTYANLFAFPPQGNGVVGKTYGSALSRGASIGPNSPLVNRQSVGMGGYATLDGQGGYWGPWANGGQGVQHRYLGLEFLISGKVHFGWARFNVRVFYDNRARVDAVLTGYAYETVPNKPIIAGKTKGPDDRQGSLGRRRGGDSELERMRM